MSNQLLKQPPDCILFQGFYVGWVRCTLHGWFFTLNYQMCILYTFETGPVTVTDMFVTGAKKTTLVCHAMQCIPLSTEKGVEKVATEVKVVEWIIRRSTYRSSADGSDCCWGGFAKEEYYWGRGGSKQVRRVRRGGSGPGCWHFSRNAGRRNIKEWCKWASHLLRHCGAPVHNCFLRQATSHLLPIFTNL